MTYLTRYLARCAAAAWSFRLSGKRPSYARSIVASAADGVLSFRIALEGDLAYVISWRRSFISETADHRIKTEIDDDNRPAHVPWRARTLRAWHKIAPCCRR